MVVDGGEKEQPVKRTRKAAGTTTSGSSRSKKSKAVAPAEDPTIVCCDDKRGDGGVCGAAANSDDENVVLNLKIFNNMVDDEIEGCGIDIDPLASQPYNLCGDGDLNAYFEAAGGGSFGDEPFFESNRCGGPNPRLSTNGAGGGGDFSEVPSVPPLKVVQLLKEFEEKNKHNEWPTNTSIHCYWCCHKFNNAPFGIPVKYVNDRFHVYGCFCSLECCAAFNQDSKDAADDVFERASLINMLARRLGYKNYVKPAPNKLALKIFGGHMEINEFRGYCNTNRILNTQFPPMMSLTQQIEEINETDVNNDYKYIPIDTDRINKYKEKIKLKRNKPVTNFKNTLDHTMNLKYGTSF